MRTGSQNTRHWLVGTAIALGLFLLLGSVTALWENPFFIRMTPAGDFEIALLAIQSALLGLFFAIRPAVCSTKTAASGGVLGFLGVACPVCNQVLLVIFGTEALLTYFEPIRIYVAATGVVLTAVAVMFALRIRRTIAAQSGV